MRLKFYADTVIFAQAFPLLIDFVHPSQSPQKIIIIIIITEKKKWKLLCSPN